MQRVYKILFMLLFSLTALCASVDVSVGTLDNAFDRTGVLGNWEINSKYLIQVKLYNNSGSPRTFNRVEANLDFDSTKFDYLAKNDRISGWTATNFFLIQNGHVQYQRGSNTGEASLTIPAGSYYVIYEILVKVKSGVSLGASNINLDPNFTHVLEDITDLTNNKTNLTVTVVNDITPPVTRIIPDSDMHLNHVIHASLEVDPNANTNCGDLKEIRYTTDGSTPTLGSLKYNGQFALQQNQTTVVKWFGIDNANNQETVKTSSYRIDNIQPVITSVYLLPADKLKFKRFSRVDIYFTAYDDIELSQVSVMVGSTAAQFETKIGNSYHYSYTAAETSDSQKTITITATDHAGNIKTDSDKHIYIDNTPPTFTLDYISPPSANVGTTVVFQFTASEELDQLHSTVNIGANSPAYFLGNNNLHYRYARVLNGAETSGWIQVYGKDLAGNIGYNLNNNNIIHISGYDLLNNYGEAYATFNIAY